MTVSINATFASTFYAIKQVTTSDPTATPPTLNLNLGIPALTWNSSTTPDGEDCWSGVVTLTAGAATIDLTNLTQTGLSTVVNATGLKLRAIAVLADSANANVIAIGTGASNGYTQIGTISQLYAGCSAVHTCAGSTAIDGTHKTLDIAGTGSQKLSLLLVFGS